jgi:hypothetical protein
MYNFDLTKRYKSIFLVGSWLMAVNLIPSNAWAAGCEADGGANFTLLVDSSSSCAALSSNMTGCETDATGTCVIPNPNATIPGDPDFPDIVVKVIPSDAVGSVPLSLDSVSWSVVNGPEEIRDREIDFVISLGATGGGTCGASHTPGVGAGKGPVFLKSNNTYQKVNGLFFCSDFFAPPPSVPQLTLSKTVMLAGGTCDPNGNADDVENLSLKVNMAVEYCFYIRNVGIGDAAAVVLSDPAVTFTGGDGFGNLAIGTLLAGGSTLIKSNPVTIDTRGELVNTASVSGDAANDPSFQVPDAIDSATVNGQLALVSCPDDAQAAVDNFFTSTDGFRYAALLDPTNPDRVSICVPSTASGEPATVIECVDQCTIKEACKADPSIPQCNFPNSKCVESDNWTTGTVGSCTDLRGEGLLPYCWEAIRDRNALCDYKEVEPLQGVNIDIQLHHDNPFCYTSCVDISDLKTCSLICF